MPFAARLFFTLLCILAFARTGLTSDLDQDEPNPIPDSPPQVLSARNQADTAYQQRDYAKVIELTNWLLENFPQDHPYVPYYLRASAKIELGRASGSSKQVRDGIADARQALAVSGTAYPWLHIPYLYGLSSLAEIERRPEHAEMGIKVITPILSLPTHKDYTEDDRANLFYQRGLAYAAKRDFKLAAADHAEAIRLSPGHLGSYVKRAAALASLGQTKQALAAYDDAVSHFPSVLLVFNDRGNFKRSTGDRQGAIEDFSRCLQIDPKFAIAYINRGLCLAEQNDPEAAVGDYSEALKLKPDATLTILAYRLRAAARLAIGNAAAAVTDFAAAIKASPPPPSQPDATLYEERGFAQLFQKKFAEAIADFAKARQTNPQLTHLLAWQSLAQARAGHASEARALLVGAKTGKSAPTGWTAKLCSFLLDETSEAELLAAAAEGNTREKSQHLCEAHYFIGQKQLLSDDAVGAAEHFKEAVAGKEYSPRRFAPPATSSAISGRSRLSSLTTIDCRLESTETKPPNSPVSFRGSAAGTHVAREAPPRFKLLQTEIKTQYCGRRPVTANDAAAEAPGG